MAPIYTFTSKAWVAGKSLHLRSEIKERSVPLSAGGDEFY